MPLAARLSTDLLLESPDWVDESDSIKPVQSASLVRVSTVTPFFSHYRASCTLSAPPTRDIQPSVHTHNMADPNGTSAPVSSSSKRQKLDVKPHKTTLEEFGAVFPTLEADLLAHAQKYKLPEAELEWFRTVSLTAGSPVI